MRWFLLLQTLIKNGQFRQDLYYRPNVITIQISPLRERKEDIPILVHHLVKKISGEYLNVSQYMQPAGMQDAAGKEGMNYNLKEMTAILEKDLILKALKKFASKTKAIQELGISRSSFYEKIRKYGIDVDHMDLR